MRDNQPRWIAALFVVLAFAPLALGAQGGLSLLDDASLVPRGLARLRMPLIWTRYDQRFGKTGPTALGAPFTSDSLGAALLTPLATTQSLIQAASATTSKLSLGKSRLDALAREEQMPFTLEYGLLDRLSLSLVVPVVRKRLSGLLRLDSTGANVGPNPNRLGGAPLTTNNQVQTQFASAATQLQTRLNACTASPGSAGCPALLARQAEAQALIASSQSFAGTVGTLYGKTGASGEAFVPRNASAAQIAVAARVADFNLKYKDLLVSAIDLITAVPVGAAGPAGVANVNSYVLSDLRRDSIATGELLGVGDVELGFKYLAINHPARERGDLAARVLVGSSVRFPSGSRQAPIGVADLRIGDGAIGFDARAIGEVQRGRAALLGAATFTSVGVNKAMPASDTRRISVDVEPRWNLTAAFSIHGSYSMRTADITGNTQLAGGGVSFTSISNWQRGTRPLPMEMRYSHLETINGAVGAAKFTRDQLEVRIYFQRGR
jgi:hypothetical protein